MDAERREVKPVKRSVDFAGYQLRVVHPVPTVIVSSIVAAVRSQHYHYVFLF